MRLTWSQQLSTNPKKITSPYWSLQYYGDLRLISASLCRSLRVRSSLMWSQQVSTDLSKTTSLIWSQQVSTVLWESLPIRADYESHLIPASLYWSYQYSKSLLISMRLRWSSSDPSKSLPILASLQVSNDPYGTTVIFIWSQQVSVDLSKSLPTPTGLQRSLLSSLISVVYLPLLPCCIWQSWPAIRRLPCCVSQELTAIKLCTVTETLWLPSHWAVIECNCLLYTFICSSQYVRTTRYFITRIIFGYASRRRPSLPPPARPTETTPSPINETTVAAPGTLAGCPQFRVPGQPATRILSKVTDLLLLLLLLLPIWHRLNVE